MRVSTTSLTTSFQARAATRPKPAVERVIICLTMARGRPLIFGGGVIFLDMGHFTPDKDIFLLFTAENA